MNPIILTRHNTMQCDRMQYDTMLLDENLTLPDPHHVALHHILSHRVGMIEFI